VERQAFDPRQACIQRGCEKVGTVYDIVVAPDKSVSYAIIDAQGFIGIPRHDVVVPVDQLDFVNGKLVLRGATRDALKAMPAFQYAKLCDTEATRCIPASVKSAGTDVRPERSCRNPASMSQ
jgi:sporulation protein YlmC with PRC-barrel domain